MPQIFCLARSIAKSKPGETPLTQLNDARFTLTGYYYLSPFVLSWGFGTVDFLLTSLKPQDKH